MLPSQQQFIDKMKAMNIKLSDRVVLYTHAGNLWATRVYWMFRTFGHQNVSVLNGGLKKWVSEGKSTQSCESGVKEEEFAYKLSPKFISYFEDMKKLAESENPEAQIIDTRNAADFDKAHIAGSKNFPMSRVLNQDGTVLNSEKLGELVKEQGLDFAKPIVFSCQTGMSCTVMFAAFETLKAPDVKVYDGSWAEYVNMIC